MIDKLTFVKVTSHPSLFSQHTRLAPRGEYVNKEYESTALDYSVTGCDKRFEGIISRKIDDQDYGLTNHDIGEYVNKVDVDALEPGQLMVLKCAVFNDADLMDYQGHYFYTVIGLKKVDR